MPNHCSPSVAPLCSEQPTRQLLWYSPPLRDWSMRKRINTETIRLYVNFNVCCHFINSIIGICFGCDKYLILLFFPHVPVDLGCTCLQATRIDNLLPRLSRDYGSGIFSYTPCYEITLAREEQGEPHPLCSSKARVQNASWLDYFILIIKVPKLCTLPLLFYVRSTRALLYLLLFAAPFMQRVNVIFRVLNYDWGPLVSPRTHLLYRSRHFSLYAQYCLFTHRRPGLCRLLSRHLNTTSTAEVRETSKVHHYVPGICI